MSQNHCSEMIGSTRAPERCENGTVWVYGLLAADQPDGAQVLEHAHLALGRA